MASKKIVGHLYAYGDIMNIQSASADEYGIVSLSQIMKGVNQNKDADEFLLHIHSVGGDLFEALAIYDFLKGTGKPINTVVEGVCASAATVIFLAGETRSLTPNSKFLIHNPMVGAFGDADSLAETAERLKQEEDKVVAFYVEKTGGDTAQIIALMQEDKFIDASIALEMKFATEILDDVKAFAVMTSNHRIEPVTNKQTMESKVDNFLKSIKSLATEMLGMKAEADTTDPSQTPPKVEPEEVPVEEEVPTPPPAEGPNTDDPETAPEQLPAPDEKDTRITELEAQLEAERQEKVEMKATLEEAEKAMKHVKSTFTPQNRVNNFKREGKTDEEEDIKVKMEKVRANLKKA